MSAALGRVGVRAGFPAGLASAGTPGNKRFPAPHAPPAEFLAHKDDKVRKAAQDELLTRKPDERNKILNTALASEYLGDRIAAVEALTQLQQTKPKFDPWAQKAAREAALTEELNR